MQAVLLDLLEEGVEFALLGLIHLLNKVGSSDDFEEGIAILWSELDGEFKIS